MDMKKCNKCKRELPLNSDYFHKKKDSFTSNCKECSNGRFTKFLQLKDGEMFCNKCDKILPYTEEYFPIDKSAKDGFRKTCHVCSGRLKGYGAKREMKLSKPYVQGKYNKQPTIEEVKEFCIDIGGACISDRYINNKIQMDFKCPTCDEIFNRTYSDHKERNTPECGECSRKNKSEESLISRRKIYLEETLSICSEIGLKLLSVTFDNPHADLEFECSMCNEPFKRRLVVLRDSRSSTCHPCSQKIVAENRGYKIEEVRAIFENEGCYLITDEYHNNKQKLEYICDCGESDTKSLSNFIYGQRCFECGVKKQADSKRTPYEEVQRVFEDGGCTLLSEEFIHSNIPLDYICECGNKSRIKPPAFKYGVRCRTCGGNEPYTIEEVDEYFIENECVLITDFYSDVKQPLEYICKCGENAITSFTHFRRSPYKKCRDCANKLNGERMRGKNHPNWNPNLTEKDREDRRLDGRNKTWRYDVYKRDSFTCQCCGDKSGDLNAHHKDGYNWCKDRRYDVENGITLCFTCHSGFHSKYGYGDNTKEQWDEHYQAIVNERRIS